MPKSSKDNSILGQIISAIVVAFLVGGTTPWWWKEFLGDRGKVISPSPSVAPTSVKNEVAKNDSSIDYDLISGSWVVTEKVVPEQGGWEIVWSFTADVHGKSLKLKGKKIRVNGKEPTIREKQAFSIFSLTLNTLQSNGTFKETNYKNEVLMGDVKIFFSDGLTSFSGKAFQEGKEVSTLTGKKYQLI